jgi:molybdopterin molybdotransferase
MMPYSVPAQVIKRLVPLSEALAALDGINPVASHDVDVLDSAGRVLAMDVTAPSALPQRAQALTDGVSVISDKTLDASTFAPVLLVDPVRVVTGSPIPDGADAVAKLNVVQFRGEASEIIVPIAPGEGVLAAGGECAAGALLRRSGSFVRASDAAIFALAGITRIAVRTPRICIGCARESSALRAVADMFAHELKLQKIDADVMSLDDALRSQNTDAVIGIGGTGDGINDSSVVALAKRGRVVFHGVGLMPGETAAFGFSGKTPVLLIPGRFDSALAIWRILGRRFLMRLYGSDETEILSEAVLTRKVTSSVGIAEFVPVRCEAGKAEPLAGTYLPLSLLANANAWILVPPASEGYQANTPVTLQSWR